MIDDERHRPEMQHSILVFLIAICAFWSCTSEPLFGPPTAPPCQGSTKGCVQTPLWWQTGDTSPSTWSALQTYLNTAYAGGGTFQICKSITVQNYLQNEWSPTTNPTDSLAELIAALLNVDSQASSGNACISGSALSAKNNLLQDLLCASGYTTTGCGSPITTAGCGPSGTSWSTYASALDNSVVGAGLGQALSYYNAGSDNGCSYGPCSCSTYNQANCCTVVH